MEKRPWGMKANEMKRLEELESENGQLKKLVADQALNIKILKEAVKGMHKASPLLTRSVKEIELYGEIMLALLQSQERRAAIWHSNSKRC